MLLFREIYGWLRYLVAKDPLCMQQGIAVEEIYSTFAPLGDTNDGIRTLVIHRVQDGMTPRLEYRALGLHPQVYWYDSGASEGELVAVTNQFGFPGDYKSWDCSDFCQWMLTQIQKRLCGLNNEDQEVTVTVTSVTNFKQKPANLIDLAIVQRLIDAVKEAVHTGAKFDKKMMTDLLKDEAVIGKGKKPYDMFNFALSVIYWFDMGKLSWKDIDALEDEISPGKDIIDWSWLKRQLSSEPQRHGKLPPPILDIVTSSVPSLMSTDKVRHKFDSILRRFTQGKHIGKPKGIDQVRFGISAITHFKNGDLPYQYLQQLELCDPYELVLPWSFIRRNVLSYTKNQICAANDNDSLVDTILSWLKNSHLLLLLYKGEPTQEDALTKALQAQLQHHISQTLSNDFWIKHIVNTMSSDNLAEMKRALQVEFDLWLLDALSPAIQQYKLPLSPHAFSIEQKDQETYNKMYKIWESMIKDYLKSYRSESGARLTDAIAKFYDLVISLWKTDALKDYKAKTPSASKILDAVEKNNTPGLLSVLCDDFEKEIGNAMPDDIKERLMASPYFNAINREVRLQGMLI